MLLLICLSAVIRTPVRFALPDELQALALAEHGAPAWPGAAAHHGTWSSHCLAPESWCAY
ncbi:hypothetical protein HaLaN_20397 [Haematococcus lacustris]|uniref:Uncharacterized protein n=1 Tax=Haematococcus lacustris TaxID=44745 RepID=A0A699ZW17_HAELA|nr:hypothetical protein HaLaN_20397 [Haematococcus lacustris]